MMLAQKADKIMVAPKQNTDSFRKISSFPNMTERKQIVDERTICYASSFDLDADEWFDQFENLTKLCGSIHAQLGTRWQSWLKEAIQHTNST